MADFLILTCARVFGALFDIVTLPLYSLLQRPWRQWPARSMLYGVSKSGAPEGPYESTLPPSPLDQLVADAETIDDILRSAVKRGGTRAMLGTREVLGEATNAQSDGNAVKKLNLGSYSWSSFEEVNRRVGYLAAAYHQIGLRPKSRVCILAETRQEWLMSALAAVRSNITVVTLYANLGEKGIIYGLNDSQTEVVIVSEGLIDVLLRNVSKLESIKHVIYLENSDWTGTRKQRTEKTFSQFSVHSFNEFELKGRLSPQGELQGPTADDVAIIMYTSGSTGTPKGVELTHKNILTVIKGFIALVDEEIIGGTYIGYLPLAHIFELTMELISLCLTMRIGYSSPLTLTDQSPAIVEGQPGDLSLLKPMMMPMVPLILDRLKKSVLLKVAGKGRVFQHLFNYAIIYKTFWMQWGFETPLLDKLLFNKMKTILGGNLRRVIIGSAQVSEDSHVFARACLCRNILCGYGMTETAAAISVQRPGALTPSVCGAPLRNIYVRLQPWPEGGYDPQDKPRPRGELLAGGSVVAKSYLNRPELTEETFVEIGGIRYLKTGDIGEMTEQGEIRIIDRKKDLFKGPTGEYIALGRVEADLKTCVLVENVCVYGDPESGRLVAVVPPNPTELQKLAQRIRISGTLDNLCENLAVKREVVEELKKHCHLKQLTVRETPSAVVLCPTPWTTETGFVTASMKVCRKPIIDYYQDQIQNELQTLLARASS